MIIHLLLGVAFLVVYIGGFLWWIRCMIMTEYKQLYRGIALCGVVLAGICWAAQVWGLH